MSKHLNALTRDQASSASQETFDDLQQKVGFLPNIYAAIGNSAVALNAALAFNAALAKGELTAREAEVIKLATSEANGCAYCVAAHTAVGQMQGLSEEQTRTARTGTMADAKLNAVAQLTRNMVSSMGHPDPAHVKAFFAAGYSKGALVELAGLRGGQLLQQLRAAPGRRGSGLPGRLAPAG